MSLLRFLGSGLCVCALALPACAAPEDETDASTAAATRTATHDVTVLDSFGAKPDAKVPASSEVRAWSVRDVAGDGFDGLMMVALDAHDGALFAVGFDRRTSRAVVFARSRGATPDIDAGAIGWVKAEMERMGQSLVLAGDFGDGTTAFASLDPRAMLSDGEECTLRLASATLLVVGTWEFSLAAGLAASAAAAAGWGVYDIANGTKSADDFSDAGFQGGTAVAVVGAAKVLGKAARGTGIAGLVVIGAFTVYGVADAKDGVVNALLPDACRRSGFNDTINHAFGWNETPSSGW